MTLFAYLNGSDIGHKVRLNGFGLTSNADGSTGIGGIVFDDSAADLTVRGFMSVIVKETACTSAPVLFAGYVLDRTYGRNGEAQYRVGSQRFVDTNLMDLNAKLHHRLITGTDGKRPAETHNERIDWLVGSSYLSGLIDDVSLVDTSNPRPFEEADYRGQYADDVLNDIAGPIFRTFFLYPTQPTGGTGLFFDTPTATVSTSTLTISNVLSDLSSTCFAPVIDATLHRDPSEVYSKIRYTYAKGLVIENDEDTVDEFFDDNHLGHRGLNVENTRIGSEASARIMADSLLERDSGENDTISVTIQVPAASAGLVQAGQRIGVRFTDFPGYATQQFTRVTSRTIQQSPGTDAFYDIHLELNNHGLSSVGGGGAPGPGEFPHPPTSEGGHWYEFSFTTDVLGSAGNAGVGIASMETGFSSPAETTSASTNTVGAVFAADSTYNYHISTAGVLGGGPGVWDYGGRVAVALHAGYPANVGGTGTIWTYGEFGGGDTIISGSFTTPGDTSSDHRHVSLSIAKSGGSSDHEVIVSGWIDPVGWDAGDTDPGPPSPAQPVGPENVTMDGADGTTTYPFADGSLRVFVDNTDQTAAITTYDGAAGTFTLAFTPTPTEHVVVFYQGR